MLEGCKKKKDEFIKQSVVNLRRRNDEIAHTHRDIVLRELGKDKVKKITNIDNIPDRCEVYYNKYQALNVNIPDTDWYLKIKENLQNKVSNFFILHGNITDQAVPRWKVEEYLKEKLISDFGIDNICCLDLIYLNEELENLYRRYDVSNIMEDRMLEIAEFLKKNKEKRKKALILRYPEYIIPETNNPSNRTICCVVTLRNLLDDLDFLESGSAVFILSDSASIVSKQLTQSNGNATLIEVPLPNVEQRLEMIEYLEETNGRMLPDKKNGAKVAANITSGLTLNHIEKLWRKHLLKCDIDFEKIREYKREIIKKEYQDRLEVVEPSKNYTLDKYGGMSYIKQYLREGVIKPILQGDTKIIPKGFLFMGSPGTGKSFMAKCIASETGINLVELKISKFHSKWVGETEQNLERALSCVKAFSPCFLFIDEIEQVLQRGNEDSNAVRGNVFQMMMNFMSEPENRGNIIVIGATNYPNKLDEALKRAGRFDVKLVFTPPLNNRDIEDILKVQIDKLNYPIGFETYGNEYEEMLDKLNGYSQAELELVTTKALSLAKRRGIYCITSELMFEAIGYIRKANNERIEEMIEIAINECNDLEFIPKELIQDKPKSNIKKLKWD